MSKYAPLADKLKSIPQREWQTSFKELERMLGFELPKSARQHRAWWSNNPTNSVMTKTWTDAGWRTEQVDMEKERLVFCKVSRTSKSSKTGGRLFGALAGSVRILSGDVTKPTGDRWKAAR